MPKNIEAWFSKILILIIFDNFLPIRLARMLQILRALKQRRGFWEDYVKAVRFHNAKDIRVEDVPAPSKKLGANDVLIKPLVTGICAQLF